jgi:RNA polymerase sigma-70 factor (ECF subfamily)
VDVLVSHEVRFRRIYDENYAPLMGYALRRAAAEDAAEIVSETFLIAWRRLSEVPDGERTRLWLYGTARRVVANHVRSAGRQRRLGERLAGLPVEHVPGPGETHDESAAVGRAFTRLAEADRELLLLAGWEELDAGQIAEVLGTTRGAARVRLHRARARFGRELDAEGVKRPGRAGHVQTRWATARPGIEESL